MHRLAVLLGVMLGVMGGALQQGARAQITPNLPTIALKSGETVEVTEVGMAINCRSIMTETPVAEVMEGPSEVVVSIKEAMVIPRKQNCDKPVKGGKLVFTAKDVEDYSTSKLTVRITYHTKDGVKQFSQAYNITLFPKQ
ncbi:MAG: hypothetical protein ACLPX9_09105 [Rhodomicrobium sp.]